MFKFLSLLLLTQLYLTEANEDFIKVLPGLNTPVNFSQFAGYISIDNAVERNLFYWFVESERSPSKDPLVLWLNGGPGCSSFNGLFEEQGPYYVKKDFTLGLNKYSWNKISNMIFLESPLGVGFSYSSNTSDYKTGDNETAARSLTFLVNFFKKYPQFKTNKFYITGESYAGHYIPDLVSGILTYNKFAKKDSVINLAGFAIGNAWTDSDIDNLGVIEYIYSHNLISNETYHGILNNCNFHGTPYIKKNLFNPEKCKYFSQKMSAEEGNINAYDIYTDVCSHSSSKLISAWANSNIPLSLYAAQKQNKEKNKVFSPYDPCEDLYLVHYLNQDNVQKAIHAKKPAVPWSPCSNIVNGQYSKPDVAASKLFRYPEILGNGLKVLIYSGDVDSVVPTTGTRMWIKTLNVTQTSGWKPWSDSAGQVGGYTVEYDTMTFATVRNAGHEVPSFQPLRAFDLFKRYIL